MGRPLSSSLRLPHFASFRTKRKKTTISSAIPMHPYFPSLLLLLRNRRYPCPILLLHSTVHEGTPRITLFLRRLTAPVPFPLLIPPPPSSSSSRPPNAESYTDPSPRRRRRSSEEQRAKAKAKDKTVVAAEETSSFSTARRLGYQRPYSFTELCGPSWLVWMSKSEMFAPPASIAPHHPRTFLPLRLPHLVRPARSLKRASRPHGQHLIVVDAQRLIGVPRPSSSHRERTVASTHDIIGAGLEFGEKVRKPTRAMAAKGGDHSPTRTDKDPKGASSTLQASNHATARLVLKKHGRDTRGKMLGASESMEDRAAGGLA
ncbi:hypothetical protein LXA43DRAFT_301798 [Ganoderma leucocontextum]|nr:hypothetical protein LXA43DRAFT_301798 [Ganoderma leucocontextum]